MSDAGEAGAVSCGPDTVADDKMAAIHANGYPVSRQCQDTATRRERQSVRIEARRKSRYGRSSCHWSLSLPWWLGARLVFLHRPRPDFFIVESRSVSFSRPPAAF